MKWEYILIVVLAIIIILVITYLVGEKSWGKEHMSHIRGFAFWFYRRVNRFRFKTIKQHKILKNILMLHLMKVSDEITNPNPDFKNAKNGFDGTTSFSLLDIFDDKKGKRYLLIDVGKYGGKYIFEIMEYIRVAYNQDIKEYEIKKLPADKENLKKELETKPILKIVK